MDSTTLHNTGRRRNTKSVAFRIFGIYVFSACKSKWILLKIVVIVIVKLVIIVIVLWTPQKIVIGICFWVGSNLDSTFLFIF